MVIKAESTNFPIRLSYKSDGSSGEFKAGDIQTIQGVSILNPEHKIVSDLSPDKPSQVSITKPIQKAVK